MMKEKGDVMKKEEKEKYIRILNDRSNLPEDISKKAKEFLPAYLYRYRSFETEYWRKEIFEGEVYLAPASALNDPMDCLAYFDGSKLPTKCKLIEAVIAKALRRGMKISPMDAIHKISTEQGQEVIEWAKKEGKKVIQMKVDLKEYKLNEERLV